MEDSLLKDLYVEELREIYDAENQLVNALPEMAKAASSEALRLGFQRHLEQTREHVRRLEQVFNDLGVTMEGRKSKGMRDLVGGVGKVSNDGLEGHNKDMALISAAQRVEHYEIAAYGTVRCYAELLDQQKTMSLLEKTVQEERDADEKLTELAERVNLQALRSRIEDESSVNRHSETARMLSQQFE